MHTHARTHTIFCVGAHKDTKSKSWSGVLSETESPGNAKGCKAGKQTRKRNKKKASQFHCDAKFMPKTLFCGRVSLSEVQRVSIDHICSFVGGEVVAFSEEAFLSTTCEPGVYAPSDHPRNTTLIKHFLWVRQLLASGVTWRSGGFKCFAAFGLRPVWWEFRMCNASNTTMSNPIHANGCGYSRQFPFQSKHTPSEFELLDRLHELLKPNIQQQSNLKGSGEFSCELGCCGFVFSDLFRYWTSVFALQRITNFNHCAKFHPIGTVE